MVFAKYEFSILKSSTKDLVIRLQSTLPRISLCLLTLTQGALLKLRPAIFAQLHSYAHH